jgi:hypothetical protein
MPSIVDLQNLIGWCNQTEPLLGFSLVTWARVHLYISSDYPWIGYLTFHADRGTGSGASRWTLYNTDDAQAEFGLEPGEDKILSSLKTQSPEGLRRCSGSYGIPQRRPSGITSRGEAGSTWRVTLRYALSRNGTWDITSQGGRWVCQPPLSEPSPTKQIQWCRLDAIATRCRLQGLLGRS